VVRGEQGALAVAINLPYYVRPGDIYSQIMGQGQAAPRTMADYYPGFTGGYDTGLYQRLRDEAAARAAAQGAAVPGLLDGGGAPGEVSMGTSFGNPADAIAFGQALQGYGKSLGGMAPGGLLAGLLGSGIVNAGVNALGAMEAQAAEQAAQAATLGQTVADVFGVAYGDAGFNSSGGVPGAMGLGPGASQAEANAINAAIEAAAAENAASPGGTTDASSPGGTDYGSDGFGGYAKGGKVTMRGLLVDEMLPGPDDGYAALQAGEYVIKKSTTKKLGDKKLKALNEGKASIKMRKE
jgi:hypothetical protein